VIDSGGKVNLRWLEWVVGREVYGKEKDTSSVWRLRLSSRQYDGYGNVSCHHDISPGGRQSGVTAASEQEGKRKIRSNLQVP